PETARQVPRLLARDDRVLVVETNVGRDELRVAPRLVELPDPLGIRRRLRRDREARLALLARGDGLCHRGLPGRSRGNGPQALPGQVELETEPSDGREQQDRRGFPRLLGSGALGYEDGRGIPAEP